ncbi:MAG: endonuclease III domain-containing protein [Nitrospirae bacterium]|nr:endonuclease III domain-containing protein [Nitrospirota bacterium]
MNRLLEIYRRLYDAFGPQHWWPGETPFEIAVGAILTQNTNWGNVEKAIMNLKKENALSPEIIHKIKLSRLASLIRPAGYFNIKAKRLKAFISFLMNEYEGSLKRMKEEDTQILRLRLLRIHGIGPETADSIILYALEKPVFVVDAYTKRALSRHEFIEFNRTYEDFQKFFHSSLNRDVKLFNEYHALFVKLGKTYCRKKPICNGCPLEGV